MHITESKDQGSEEELGPWCGLNCSSAPCRASPRSVRTGVLFRAAQARRGEVTGRHSAVGSGNTHVLLPAACAKEPSPPPPAEWGSMSINKTKPNSKNHSSRGLGWGPLPNTLRDIRFTPTCWNTAPEYPTTFPLTCCGGGS